MGEMARNMTSLPMPRVIATRIPHMEGSVINICYLWTWCYKYDSLELILTPHLTCIMTQI